MTAALETVSQLVIYKCHVFNFSDVEDMSDNNDRYIISHDASGESGLFATLWDSSAAFSTAWGISIFLLHAIRASACHSC